MRADSSISRSFSGEGTGEADAPRVLKQRFVLEEKLGSGGMGTVFRAKDLRKVEARDRQPFLAVKVLNNDFREHPEAFIALQREAAKSQALSHTNIVSIYDYDKDGDVPFIVMELLEGQELADLLRAYPSGLPQPMAWKVIEGICAGLKHAHDAGIVHADFKPGNVYISPSNAPKILDFGIARAVQLSETDGEDTLFDPARLAALTPAYASREMLNGDNPEPRDDLYSLGIVIYLILTGHHPFGRLSAEEAASEDLKPEKPRGISRRQWQVIARCLAFNRQDRPADVLEVQNYLLQPSPWRSRSALAAVGAFALALTLNYFVDDAELTEVKQEVRQSTLLDAQVARLAGLLADPLFDENWEAQLAQEYDTLDGLQQATVPGEEEAAEYSGVDYSGVMAQQIRDAYTHQIESYEDLGAALALLHRGERFGPLPDAVIAIERKAFGRVRHLLDSAQANEQWLSDLQAELELLNELFPDSQQLAELDLEIAELLEGLIRDAIVSRQTGEAQTLLSELRPRLFDEEALDDLQQLINQALAQQEALRSRRQFIRIANEQRSILDDLLAVSCLRLDLAALQATSTQLIATQPASAGEIDAAVVARVGECVGQLAELDPDRAHAMQRQTEALFGTDTLSVMDAAVDPCGLTYLVGNGALSDRKGSCSDRITDGEPGPRLVVVPSADGLTRFAMTKHEISWNEFRRFCDESDDGGSSTCELVHRSSVADERLPVTGVSLATARAYALWLTETTGYTYRLPTSVEWLRAARGEPDPNRNCQVRLEGLERGHSPIAATAGQGNEFGLVNMLGNVQEWVVDDDAVTAVGGAFSDPIADCVAETARDHGGDPAANTGFRLVRELT